MRIVLFVIRSIYLIGGLFFSCMERAANWITGYSSKTEYVRKGECNKCGKCCHLLAIQYPNFFNRFPRLIKLTKGWHEFRYGFKYFNSEGNYLLYECNFLTAEGRCGIYRFRPRLCREYPKTKLYGKPSTHIDCGFYFVRRDGKSTFDKALHDASSKKL